MIDTLRHSRSPLFLQIAEILRQRLSRGAWKPGELLPTLTQLAAEYLVAKVTVRQAVKILEGEGLLEARRGRGTVVLKSTISPRRLHLGTRLSTLVDMYRGDKPELDLLKDRDAEIPGTPFIGQLSQNGYHLLRRTHSRDAQTYCVISIYIENKLFELNEARLRSEIALPVLVDSEQINVKRARQTFVVGKCDYETASLIDLTVGDPVVEVRRVICDADDHIVYLADVTYRGDFVQLEMDLLP
jgi:GntR family transcriptional regulator